MADLVIVAANVREGVQPTRISQSTLAGETIDAGKFAYFDVPTSRLKLAVNTSPATSKVRGMALNSAAIGQPVDLIEDGEVQIGTGAVSVAYFLSDTPGVAAPEVDILTGEQKVFVGIGAASGRLRLRPLDSEQLVP